MRTATLVEDRRLALFGIVGFTVALAAASQVAIPLPGTPVPITLQPMLVVLAGMMLGPVFGAVSMFLYLIAGAAGLPVFAPMGAPGMLRFLGPTGGYLLAYPVAAYIAGVLALRVRTFSGRALSAAAGIGVLYVGGLAQLAIITGSLTRAAVLGVVPFVALDGVKSLIAAAVTRSPAVRSPARAD
ncbi:MAG TPA: biotin transporter BioY [Gemmatimonadaceae bacterium]